MKLKTSTLLVAGILAVGITSPQSASADPYCFAFGLYANCVETPNYEIPQPVPVKAVPKWVCQTVSVTSIVLSWVKTNPVITFFSRVVTIPSTYCTFV